MTNCPKENQVFVVLGMHRSGTSVISRSLIVLGVQLGTNLMPPQADNPKGFWEDRDVVAINDELLVHFGSAWDNPYTPWQNMLFTTNPYHSRMVSIVTDRLKKHGGVWGVKDPRMCRLLRFWMPVFKSCHCKVNILISLRNPNSIAESLQKRDHMSLDTSNILWLQHTVYPVLNTRNCPRLVIDYDMLINDPEKQMRRMANYFKLPFDPVNNELWDDFMRSFLDERLRHSVFSRAEIANLGDIQQDVVGVYDLLWQVSNDTVSINADDVQTTFAGVATNLRKFSRRSPKGQTILNFLQKKINRKRGS
jgi:hypothetical protein